MKVDQLVLGPTAGKTTAFLKASSQIDQGYVHEKDTIFRVRGNAGLVSCIVDQDDLQHICHNHYDLSIMSKKDRAMFRNDLLSELIDRCYFHGIHRILLLGSYDFSSIRDDIIVHGIYSRSRSDLLTELENRNKKEGVTMKDHDYWLSDYKQYGALLPKGFYLSESQLVHWFLNNLDRFDHSLLFKRGSE
jgi:hypothetical protein